MRAKQSAIVAAAVIVVIVDIVQIFGNRVNDNGGVLDNIVDKAINELWNDTDF